MAIERIEGRCDDTLVLPAHGGGTVTLFADVCSRALAQALPLQADYRLVQIDAHADLRDEMNGERASPRPRISNRLMTGRQNRR